MELVCDRRQKENVMGEELWANPLPSSTKREKVLAGPKQEKRCIQEAGRNQTEVDAKAVNAWTWKLKNCENNTKKKKKK